MAYLLGFIDPKIWILLMLLELYIAKFIFAFYFHRYSWHKQFDINKKFLQLVRVISWVHYPIMWRPDGHYQDRVVHLIHHKYSDTDRDPISPQRFSLLTFAGIQQDHNYRNVAEWINHDSKQIYQNSEPTDNFSILLKNKQYLGNTILCIVWTLVAGVPGLLYGLFYRHAAARLQAIDSCYLFHKRHGYHHPQDTSLANQYIPWPLLEGLHSNHHVYPSKVNTAYRWFEIDLFYYQIKLLHYLQLVILHDKNKEKV